MNRILDVIASHKNINSSLPPTTNDCPWLFKERYEALLFW